MTARIKLALAFIALLSLLVACGGGTGSTGAAGSAKQVSVVATDFKFDPATITVARGQKVQVSLQNKGQAPHNLSITDLNVKSPDVDAGKSASFEFTPDRAGTFQYVCTVPGHKDAGMVGNLVVQ